MSIKIDWSMAAPQTHRHPIIIVFGDATHISTPRGTRYFNATHGLQACFSAFVHAWQRGPALLMWPNHVPAVPAGWAGMLARLAMGCGAGVVALRGAVLPAWLPTPYHTAKSSSDDDPERAAGAFNGNLAPLWCMPAPLGCLGAHPRKGGVTLVLSDRISPKSANLPDWSFISLNNVGCSFWLAELLQGREEDLCWINVAHPDGSLKRLDHLLELPWRSVVALGNTATLAGTSVGLPIQRVHHPMYWYSHFKDKPYKLLDILNA